MIIAHTIIAHRVCVLRTLVFFVFSPILGPASLRPYDTRFRILPIIISFLASSTCRQRLCSLLILRINLVTPTKGRVLCTSCMASRGDQVRLCIENNIPVLILVYYRRVLSTARSKGIMLTCTNPLVTPLHWQRNCTLLVYCRARRERESAVEHW